MRAARRTSKGQRRRWVVVLSGILAVGAPAVVPASSALAGPVANSPFSPIVGGTPDVAVAPDGTGYVVAVEDNTPGNEGLLVLCRIPRQARSCDLRQTFSADPSGQFLATAPYVFAPSTTEVDVVGYEFDLTGTGVSRLRIWRSFDRGVTFDGGTTIGTVNPLGDLVLGPGSSVTGVTDVETAGIHVQNAALDGTNATDPPTALTSNEYASAVTVLADGSVLAASSSAETCPCSLTVQRAAPGADLNDPASWTTVYSGDATYARLATGPSGTYLMSYVTGSERWQVQAWTGATFAAPVVITTSDDDNRMALRESPSGVVYAVIQGADTLRGRPVELFRSPNGVHWSERTLAYAQNAFDDAFAIAGDGGGFEAHDALSFTGPVTVVPIPALRSVAVAPRRARILGLVGPADGHVPVLLQERVGRVWLTVGRARTRLSGRYAFAYPAAPAGVRVAVRVVAPAVEGYGQAISRVLRVR